MSRGQLVGGVRVLCYVTVLAVLTRALWRHRTDFLAGLAAVGPVRCGLSVLLALLGSWLGMLGWRRLLAASGTVLPLRTGARVYYLSNLGKYVPGGVGPVLVQADLARSLRLPVVRLAVAFVGSVLLSVVGGLLVGLLALPRLVRSDPTWWAVVPVVAGLLVPVVAPGLLTGAAARVGRWVGRPLPEVRLPGGAVLVRVLLLLAAGWAVTGVHLVVLAGGVGLRPAAASIAVVLGGFALASVAGLLAAVVPAGLGVREGVLLLTLGTLLGGGALVTVVALSRVVLTAVDVLAAGAVAVAGRSVRRDGGPLHRVPG